MELPFAMNKKNIGITAAAIILVVVIIVVVSGKRSTIEKPRRGPIVEAIYAIGTVKSDNNYTLRMSINSVIERFHVQEGQTVPKGAPLLRTDTGLAFYAPFNGTVSKRYFEEGEIIVPGQPVLTLLDLARKHVIVSLDQQSAVRVKIRQRAELSFENMRKKKFFGTIDRIYPSNTQFLAWINVSDLPPEVLPDMTADVAIEVERRDNALLVPAKAISKGMITIRRKGKTIKSKIKIGAVNNDWVEAVDDVVLETDEIIMPN